MGDERAETYLRLMAEREFRRVIRLPGWADHRMSASDIAASALWNLRRAGRILIAAGALEEELVAQLTSETDAALTVRARTFLRRPGVLRQILEPVRSLAPAAQDPAAQPMRVVPLGQVFRLGGERAPADLHFLSLVATPAQATIAIAMRMRWPSDGSSADLELTGAGYHHLPYDQLWLTDDRGARYPVIFDGEGGTATWQGVLQVLPAPAPETRWLDLIAGGPTQLIRLDLRPEAPQAVPARAVTGENRRTSPVDRLLAVEAEAILASAWNRPGQPADPHLGEITGTLTGAGLVAADSPAPGQLAGLCQRLGVPGHGIAGPAAAELPARWASVIAQRPAKAAGPEVFAPLAAILPDIDGIRFALAGLSLAAGESYLHVAASGLPELAGRFTRQWRPGPSVWVRDGAGNWHVTVIAEPSARAAGEAEFRLRLIPPLAAPPDALEVLVTGVSARIRAVVPVGPVPAACTGRTVPDSTGPGMADT